MTVPLHLPYTVYGRWCYILCTMRVSCTTPSIFYTHNIWHLTLHILLYYTLNPTIFYTHNMSQVTLHTMLYASIMHHAVHFSHTQHMQATLYTMLYDTLYHSNFHTHCIWQVMLRRVVYVSIMHHTFHFLHTQHMAGDAPHHALSHTAPLHLPCTQNTAVMLHNMLCESTMHHTLHFLHTTNGRWRYTACVRLRPYHVLWECHDVVFFSGSLPMCEIVIVLVVSYMANKLLSFYESIMHQNFYFPHNNAPHYALAHTAPLSPQPTTYGKWRYTPCCITQSTFSSSIYTKYGRWRSTPCSMKVSCTTPSILYTHNIWKVTLRTRLY